MSRRIHRAVAFATTTTLPSQLPFWTRFSIYLVRREVIVDFLDNKDSRVLVFNENCSGARFLHTTNLKFRFVSDE